MTEHVASYKLTPHERERILYTTTKNVCLGMSLSQMARGFAGGMLTGKLAAFVALSWI